MPACFRPAAWSISSPASLNRQSHCVMLRRVGGPIRSLGEDELSNACANDRMVHRMYGMSMSLIPSVLRGCTSVPAGHESIPSVRGRRRAPAGDVPAAGRASRNLLRAGLIQRRAPLPGQG